MKKSAALFIRHESQHNRLTISRCQIFTYYLPDWCVLYCMISCNRFQRKWCLLIQAMSQFNCRWSQEYLCVFNNGKYAAVCAPMRDWVFWPILTNYATSQTDNITVDRHYNVICSNFLSTTSIPASININFYLHILMTEPKIPRKWLF